MITLFSRVIGPVPIACFLRENHEHRLGITELPIEDGSNITDHSYREPKRFRVELADHNAASIFNALSAFQETRVPFTVVSGLYVYNNMLIKSLGAVRDERWAWALNGYTELQEAIIVSTSYAANSEGDLAGKSGQPGGKDSTNAARPNSQNTKGATTDKAAGTVTRGDQTGTSTVPNKSLLRQGLGL